MRKGTFDCKLFHTETQFEFVAIELLHLALVKMQENFFPYHTGGNWEQKGQYTNSDIIWGLTMIAVKVTKHKQ